MVIKFMRRRAALVLSLAASLAALSACGGGGGDAGTGAGAPSTTALAINSGNYVTVAQQSVSSSLYFLDSADLVLGAQTSDGHFVTRFALAQLEHLNGWFERAPKLVSGATTSYSEPCAGGGRLDLTVNDGNGNGTLDVGDSVVARAVSCIDSGETVNGTIELSLTALSGVFGTGNYSAGITLRLVDLTASSATESVIGNGEMRLSVSSTGANSSTVTIEVPSFSAAGKQGGVSFSNSISGFVLTVVKAPGGTLYTVAVSIRGTLGSSLLESRQISIETPLALTRNWSASDPSSGQLLVHGAGGSQLRITAQPGGMVLIELDADGNGSYETSVTKRWSELR